MAGYLSTVGGVIMYTLSFECHIQRILWKQLNFFSYCIVTLKLQYHPAIFWCNVGFYLMTFSHIRVTYQVSKQEDRFHCWPSMVRFARLTPNIEHFIDSYINCSYRCQLYFAQPIHFLICLSKLHEQCKIVNWQLKQ